MAKIALNKVTPIKKIEPITVQINGADITIQQYLPVQEKTNLIERVLNQAIDDTGFISPWRLDVAFHIQLVMAYSNISITEKALEDITKTYDALQINGVIQAIVNNIPEEEYNSLYDSLESAAEHTTNYLNSFVGMMRTISADYKNTEMNVDKLMATLGDEKQVGLVKNILDNLG